MSEAPSRPSGVRHLIILLLTLMSVLLYLDRFCVSFAGDYIKEDLGLTQTQMSWFQSAFFWTYALSQVPAGWLADRFGARLMLSIYVVAWSLFTAQMGLVAGFTMLLFARLMCGITQAGAYPTAGGVISRWIPLSKRATASAWVGIGGRFGGAMATALTAVLMILFVPLGTPVEFTDSDLLDAERLCSRLEAVSEETRNTARSLVLAEVEAEKSGRDDAAKSVWLRLRLRCWLFFASDRLSKLIDEHWRSDKSIEQIAESITNSLEKKSRDDPVRPAAERVTTELSKPLAQETRSEIAQIGEDFKVRELRGLVAQHRKAWGLKHDLGEQKPKPKLADSDRSDLVKSLNLSLEQVELYDAEAFGKANLPREGVGYAKRLKADEKLSPEEMRRFNRLLVEAAYPGEIRKLYGRGWRPVMIVYGLSGVIVAIGIWLVFRERPELHSRVNEAERALIETGRLASAADPASKAGRLPIRPLVTNFSLWCNCANQIGTNIGWVFLVTWLSRYFIEMHSVPILERGMMVMMPNLIGLCGGFLGGRLVDWLLPRIGLKWSRSLPPIITRFIAAGGYGMCLYFAAQPAGSALNSPWAFTAAFCLIYFSVDLGQSAFWAYAQDAGGKYVGSVLGWGNMWGNLGAAFGPLLYNHLLGENPTAAEWNSLFWLGLIAFVFAGVATFGLDASKPVFVDEPEAIVDSNSTSAN